MQFIEVSKEENVSQNEYRIKSLSVLKDIQNGYERFLRDYPKSDLSTKARSRLEELKEEERQYKAALNDSVSGDVSVFLAFLKTHKRYGFTDLLNNLQQIGDENCVKSLGSLLTWYNNMARQKTYPISVSGMVFLGPSSDGQTRIDIISALRSTGKKSAIPYIIMSLDDPEKAVETYGVNYSRGPTGPATYYYPVRQAAAEALKKMTGYDFGFDQARWEKWLENKGQ